MEMTEYDRFLTMTAVGLLGFIIVSSEQVTTLGVYKRNTWQLHMY